MGKIIKGEQFNVVWGSSKVIIQLCYCANSITEEWGGCNGGEGNGGGGEWVGCWAELNGNLKLARIMSLKDHTEQNLSIFSIYIYIHVFTVGTFFGGDEQLFTNNFHQ